MIIDKREKHASCSKEPLPFPDMRMFVFQVTIWPDESLGRKHNFVFGLLKLLQQLFWTRRKDYIIAVESQSVNNCYCQWSTMMPERVHAYRHTPNIMYLFIMDVTTCPQKEWLCSPRVSPPEQTSADALSALHLEVTCNLHLSMFHPFREPTKKRQKNVRHMFADYYGSLFSATENFLSHRKTRNSDFIS